MSSKDPLVPLPYDKGWEFWDRVVSAPASVTQPELRVAARTLGLRTMVSGDVIGWCPPACVRAFDACSHFLTNLLITHHPPPFCIKPPTEAPHQGKVDPSHPERLQAARPHQRPHAPAEDLHPGALGHPRRPQPFSATRVAAPLGRSSGVEEVWMWPVDSTVQGQLGDAARGAGAEGGAIDGWSVCSDEGGSNGGGARSGTGGGGSTAAPSGLAWASGERTVAGGAGSCWGVCAWQVHVRVAGGAGVQQRLLRQLLWRWSCQSYELRSARRLHLAVKAGGGRAVGTVVGWGASLECQQAASGGESCCCCCCRPACCTDSWAARAAAGLSAGEVSVRACDVWLRKRLLPPLLSAGRAWADLVRAAQGGSSHSYTAAAHAGAAATGGIDGARVRAWQGATVVGSRASCVPQCCLSRPMRGGGVVRRVG